MGMFDDVLCKAKLPGSPPEFATPEHRFQTKDLDCELATYTITEAGRLLDSKGTEIPFDGDLSFYTGNVVSSGPGKYTQGGEDAEWVEYRARFVQGQLQEIVETERTREAALPMSRQPQSRRPTDAELAERDARSAEKLTGRTMWVLWGGFDPDRGYAVKVVADGKHEWCVENADGELETIHRVQRDSILFDNAEDARAHFEARKAEWDGRKAEYAARVAEWEKVN